MNRGEHPQAQCVTTMSNSAETTTIIRNTFPEVGGWLVSYKCTRGELVVL